MLREERGEQGGKLTITVIIQSLMSLRVAYVQALAVTFPESRRQETTAAKTQKGRLNWIGDDTRCCVSPPTTKQAANLGV